MFRVLTGVYYKVLFFHNKNLKLFSQTFSFITPTVVIP